MNQPFIGHIDSDCFYVSAERVRYPHLVGLPCGVMGNQGVCVIAKSYEMKAMGVKTGEPIWDAQQKCPEGLYIKRDFRWYEILSRMMLGIVREFSPKVEYYSIDEFFFAVELPKGMDHLRYAEAIRDAILERVGVPATVGIARSRTLAKLISDSAKPFGASAVLDKDAEEILLRSRPVTEITGIAGRREKRLMPWGIRTCLDLANADRKLVRELLTATGEALWWELNGDAAVPIRATRPLHKNISRGGSLGRATKSPMVVFAWLVRNLERLIEELRWHKLLTGRISLAVGYQDGGWGEHAADLVVPSDRFEVLLDDFRPLLRKAWRAGMMANRMHLFAHDLRYRTDRQLGFFEKRDEKAEAIAAVKSEINQRFGRFTLRSAATLPLVGTYRDASSEYDICDVRGKICF